MKRKIFKKYYFTRDLMLELGFNPNVKISILDMCKAYYDDFGCQYNTYSNYTLKDFFPEITYHPIKLQKLEELFKKHIIHETKKNIFILNDNKINCVSEIKILM
jgi:hypothetical protein